MRPHLYFGLLFCLAVPLGAANLISNSSFELGTNGWQLSGGVPFTFNNRASHGLSCLVLVTGASLQNGPIQLQGGVSYSLSFDGHAAWGGGPYWCAVIGSGDPSDNAFGQSAGSFGSNWERRVVSSFLAPSNGNYWVKFINTQPDLFLDAVQLEAGPATPYAPKEAGGNVTRLNCVWDANKEDYCAGYKLCAGPASRRYVTTNVVAGRLNTNAWITIAGGTTYLAVMAFGDDGSESPFSSEVMWITRMATPLRFRALSATNGPAPSP